MKTVRNYFIRNRSRQSSLVIRLATMLHGFECIQELNPLRMKAVSELTIHSVKDASSPTPGIRFDAVSIP